MRRLYLHRVLIANAEAANGEAMSATPSVHVCHLWEGILKTRRRTPCEMQKNTYMLKEGVKKAYINIEPVMRSVIMVKQ